ncbi:hypothetical protein KP78_17850 [Jeotgalibacillus soli]|uniref:Photolyase/cryptochrome alpha/beta domain-containing protein n=1 Tax=Jeotgalibacillus soli TaxID=889306 RepID=A0A0C2VE48_9BACL|nr:hypothetical protein KP78_17850 [Jeotgalibacillus soli]
MNIVWLKRDLRLRDHQPVHEAVKYGETLFIYVAEPSIWGSGELSVRHFHFVLESLASLKKRIEERGGKLLLFKFEMEQVLQSLLETYGPFKLFSHEENGTSDTMVRDERVRRWMKEKNLEMIEFQHFGITRGKSSPKHFQKQWDEFMSSPYLPQPKKIMSPDRVPEDAILTIDELKSFEENLPGTPIKYGQVGGEEEAIDTLKSFFTNRYQNYLTHLSKPLQSTISSSRLSPYLAWGNLSIKTVVQQTRKALLEPMSEEEKQQLLAFKSRLYWHCQIVWHLEDHPAIHEQAFNKSFDDIQQKRDEEQINLWYHAQTGIPMVDAAMRALHQTGWINFDLRAMLVSFICNTLQQNWREPAKLLAQLFLDYEPGIHWRQVQMQTGASGKKAIRNYNPVKMGKEHDPNGEFVKRFVPELKNIPKKAIHEPWLDPGFFGLKYFSPIVDIKKANIEAAALLASIRVNTGKKESVPYQPEKDHSPEEEKNRSPKASKKNKKESHSEQLTLLLFEDE